MGTRSREPITVTTSPSTAHNSPPTSFSTGRLARMAHGSCVAKQGDAAVLATVVLMAQQTEPQDFLPLTVDYRSRSVAKGLIPIRREFETEGEVLASRLIDRSLRPLFPDGLFYETQVCLTSLAEPPTADQEVLAVNAASAALMASDIPFNGPVACVRVGYIDGDFVAHPSPADLKNSMLNLVYAGTKDTTVMIEADAGNLPLALFREALAFAHAQLVPLLEAQIQFRDTCGTPTRDLKLLTVPEEVLTAGREQVSTALAAAYERSGSQIEREAALLAVKTTLSKSLTLSFPTINAAVVTQCFDKLQKERVRGNVLDKKLRVDGRAVDQLRPITCEVDSLPFVHGSSIFERGETQALCSATLGPESVRAVIDPVDGSGSDQPLFFSFEFPPYSVGEVGKLQPGRRETGHGALARKALLSVLPTDFPYSLRLTANITMSNGSSSMAAVCGGCLALMDAGVPITDVVAGIAVGLMTETNEEGKVQRYQLLTDLIGAEDYLGDMDFKVAGTREGISAVQLDTKLAGGVPVSIVKEALDQATSARLRVLDSMRKTLPAPRPDTKPGVPLNVWLDIAVDNVGKVIGPMGTTLALITSTCGGTVALAPCPGDDSLQRVQISCPDRAGVDTAVAMIQALALDWQEGQEYEVSVTKLLELGVVVSYKGIKQALIHITELEHGFAGLPEQLLKVDDVIIVKAIAAGGVKMALSLKAMTPPPTLAKNKNPYAKAKRKEAAA